MSDLLTATFREACSWSTVSMAMSPEVGFWELSYVNVPTVNLKSCSVNVAPGTLCRRIFHFFRTNITRTYYMYQLLDMTNQQAAVHHVSKILLLTLVLATCCIDKRQHSDLL